MVLSGNTQLKLITLNQLDSLYGGFRFLNSMSKKMDTRLSLALNCFDNVTDEANRTSIPNITNITVGPIRNVMWMISHQPKSTHKNSCGQMLWTYWSLKLLFQGCSNLLYSGSKTDPDGILGLELLRTVWQKSYFQKEFFACYFCYNWHKNISSLCFLFSL